MSISLFKDTVTIYIPSYGGYLRRVIRNTYLTETLYQNGGGKLDIMIPIHGRRVQKFVPSTVFPELLEKDGFFTVSPECCVVSGICLLSEPPEGAYPVTSVKTLTVGSRRVHHVRVFAEIYSPYMNTSTEAEVI